jgi:DNA polymerase-3 subunit alpha
VHFPPVVKRYPFRGAGFYLLQGKVVDDFGVYSVEVNRMEKLGLLSDPRADE